MYRSRSPQSIWEVAVLEVWYKYRALFFLGELPEFFGRAFDAVMQEARYPTPRFG